MVVLFVCFVCVNCTIQCILLFLFFDKDSLLSVEDLCVCVCVCVFSVAS